MRSHSTGKFPLAGPERLEVGAVGRLVPIRARGRQQGGGRSEDHFVLALLLRPADDRRSAFGAKPETFALSEPYRF